MVEKIIRLVIICFGLILVSCQTVQPTIDVVHSENEQSAKALKEIAAKMERSQTLHEPEEVKPPVAVATKKSDTYESKNEVVPRTPTSTTGEQEIEIELVEEPSPIIVVKKLQQEALILQSEGRWSEAELKLERALRIDTDKVDIYHQLATVRMGQGRFSEAEQIALKGLSLTDETPEFKASLWSVIAQCRSAQSDIKGAREARSEMVKWLSND